ncbi:MAG: enoyl-CoA hydratase/isomerase family protein [Planctomycetes bacterium]|nr:enoyl-CoA hydratase/isomerase family protein [Planctomycetota bacterium]
MTYENIQRDDRDGIAFVTVTRPSKLNALNDQTIGELQHCFDALSSDDSVRAVILTGEGEKAFVAGADIGELSTQTSLTARPLAMKGQHLMDTIEACPKPVVAAVNGYALGGGCELALACHLRYASENAMLGLPEVTLGIIPGYGGTQRLPRIVGRGRAMELILTAKPIDAAEAHRIGLVNKVFPQAELLASVEKIVRGILRSGPVAVRFALDAVNHGTEMPLADGLNYEATFFGLLASTQDLKEGMGAFLEKRPAKFTGN